MSFLAPFSVSRSFLFSVLFHCVVAARSLVNVTLPLPVGSSNHGTPGLLCTPCQWSDIVNFYLLNYVAHAATVLSKPGETASDFAATVIGSLFFPAMGLYRGISAILSGAVFSKDDLTKAARSGALCMLVRTPAWRPVEGDDITNAVIQQDVRPIVPEEKNLRLHGGPVHVVTYEAPWAFPKFGHPAYVHREVIHGNYDIPPGYKFSIVPSNATFTKPESAPTKIEVASTYNHVKALVALTQTVYASLTLYRSRGDQIDRYGYAAFGLTVAPYAVMSIMNLLGNLCRPDYPCLYMVESSIMEEARRRGGTFYGAVAKLQEEPVPTVCSCSGVSEDLDHLEFSKDDVGQLLGRSPSVAGENQIPDKLFRSTSSITVVSTGRLWTVLDIPEKRNYAGTEKDLIMFIPSCNPIKSNLPGRDHEDIPFRYKIKSTALKKSSWFCKRHDWRIKFHSDSHHLPNNFRWPLIKYLVTIFISLTPVIITGLLSHFRNGSTEKSQGGLYKTWTIQWLVCGMASGVGFVLDQEAREAGFSEKRTLTPLGRAWLYFLSASSAIGGFVVVGMMLRDYGICTLLTD